MQPINYTNINRVQRMRKMKYSRFSTLQIHPARGLRRRCMINQRRKKILREACEKYHVINTGLRYQKLNYARELTRRRVNNHHYSHATYLGRLPLASFVFAHFLKNLIRNQFCSTDIISYMRHIKAIGFDFDESFAYFERKH